MPPRPARASSALAIDIAELVFTLGERHGSIVSAINRSEQHKQRQNKIGNFSPCAGPLDAATLVLPDTPSRQSSRNRSEGSHEALSHRAGDPRRQRPHRSGTGAIAGKSNDVVESLGVPYRWITSYVAGDKIYCIHEADDEETIREHARRGGFPANSVSGRQRVRSAHRGLRRGRRGVAMSAYAKRRAQRYRVSTATLSTWWVSGNESNTRRSSTR